MGGNGNTKIIEASKFYPKGAWRWEFVGRGRNVSRRCWVPGPLPRVLSCLLPVEGLPRAGHVPGMDVSVSSLSYTAMPGSNLARQAAEHIFHPYPSIANSELLQFHWKGLPRSTLGIFPQKPKAF